MKVTLDILRRESANSEPYRQKIVFETNDGNATVATALTQINVSRSYLDTDRRPVGEVRWECSCLQKKCGACAMLINGTPRLACDSKLRELGDTVRLEPLKKFPVIADLIVDRSIMLENLKTMRLWFNDRTKADETIGAVAYEASRCLQCGCCLEVCPNFYCGSDFLGTAAIVPASRIIAAAPDEQKNEIFREYKRHSYEGCGKSLACRNICPAGIDIDSLLVNSNAAAIWKRKRRKAK